MNKELESRHKKIIGDAIKNSVTVEDVARALASIDGLKKNFDEGKTNDCHGYYSDYMREAEETIRQAVKYAKERKKS